MFLSVWSFFSGISLAAVPADQWRVFYKQFPMLVFLSALQVGWQLLSIGLSWFRLSYFLPPLSTGRIVCSESVGCCDSISVVIGIAEPSVASALNQDNVGSPPFWMWRSSSIGCGHVPRGVQLPGRVLHPALSWQTCPRAQDECRPALQPPALPPPGGLWHVSHVHHVCRYVSG